jgi:hypothetical protein
VIDIARDRLQLADLDSLWGLRGRDWTGRALGWIFSDTFLDRTLSIVARRIGDLAR